MARSPSRTLQLTYLGDASQLNRVTKGAGQNVQGFGDRLKTFGKVAGAAFLAVGAASIKLGQTLFEAFEEASTANARIENLVDVMGNFEGQVAGVTDRLIEQAEATARLTGVDRNLIKESQGILLTFANVNRTAGDAGSVFDRATQAAVDLAAAGFGSVDSAANQLGKALEDPVRGLGSLREVGVSFTAEQEELIRSLAESNQVLAAQGIILEAIEGQVGGTAEATANGSDRIRQSFGLLLEQVGGALAPAFEFLVAKALEFVDKVAVWWQQNGPGIIEGFRQFGNRVRDVYDRFVELVPFLTNALRERGVFGRLRTSADQIGEAFDGVRTAFRSLIDEISGGTTEGKLDTFAGLIDTFIVKPIEFAADRVAQLLKAVELLLNLGERVSEFINRFREGQTLLQQAPTPFPSTIPGSAFTVPSAPTPTRGPTNVTVNISGAVDPEATARQVDRILLDSVRRTGGSTGGLR